MKRRLRPQHSVRHVALALIELAAAGGAMTGISNHAAANAAQAQQQGLDSSTRAQLVEPPDLAKEMAGSSSSGP